MGESSNLATRIYATLIFQPIRETEKRSRDDLDVSDWLKFQRSVNYAENNVYRIGSSFLKTLRFMVTFLKTYYQLTQFFKETRQEAAKQLYNELL